MGSSENHSSTLAAKTHSASSRSTVSGSTHSKAGAPYSSILPYVPTDPREGGNGPSPRMDMTSISTKVDMTSIPESIRQKAIESIRKNSIWREKALVDPALTMREAIINNDMNGIGIIAVVWSEKDPATFQAWFNTVTNPDARRIINKSLTFNNMADTSPQARLLR